jgi:dTDP-D-glucose 4,6-dehydratase
MAIERGEFGQSYIICDDRPISMLELAKMVAEALEKFGLSKDEVKARLDGMTDAQIHQLATSLDEVRVGGDGLGFVIAILIIAILVIVILQLTGHKVIVK